MRSKRDAGIFGAGHKIKCLALLRRTLRLKIILLSILKTTAIPERSNLLICLCVSFDA